jgi:hypothetical protein
VKQSITGILSKAAEKANELNSPNVKKAQGIARLLKIVIDVLRVLAAMQKEMSKLETRIKELEVQLSSKEDRVG